MIKQFLILIALLCSCSTSKNQEKEVADSSTVDLNDTIRFLPAIDYTIQEINKEDDSVLNYFIEQAQKIHQSPGDNNPFFSDVEDIKNIERPGRSYVRQPAYSTQLLFGVWGGNGDEPVSDFRIDGNYFDVADYDGNSLMPYILYKDSLLIFYNDFIRHGKIIHSSKDSLSITWEGYQNIYNKSYIRW